MTTPQATGPLGMLPRAIKLAAERLTRLQEMGADPSAIRPPADRTEQRAAFEAVRAASLAEFPQAVAAFLQQYGQEAWDHEQTLALRRQQQQGG